MFNGQLIFSLLSNTFTIQFVPMFTGVQGSFMVTRLQVRSSQRQPLNTCTYIEQQRQLQKVFPPNSRCLTSSHPHMLSASYQLKPTNEAGTQQNRFLLLPKSVLLRNLFPLLNKVLVEEIHTWSKELHHSKGLSQVKNYSALHKLSAWHSQFVCFVWTKANLVTTVSFDRNTSSHAPCFKLNIFCY